MTRTPAVAVTVLIAGWTAADALTPSGLLLAAAALAVAGLALLTTRRHARTAACSPAPPPASRGEHTLVIRHRDPSAAGRPRPRAPSPRTGAALA